MGFYSEALLQMQIKNLQKAELAKLQAGQKLRSQDYQQQVRVLIQPMQDKILAKWGFTLGARGFVMMQSLFNANFSTDPEIQENVLKINAQLGFDYTWMP